MVGLSDFNSARMGAFMKPDPMISDFNPKVPQSTAVNEATINNIAAHTAILGSSEELLKTYSNITNELKSGSSSATLNDMLERQAVVDYSANLSALRNVLADPAISTDDKARYTQGFAELTQTKLGSRSINVDVARAAQITPSDPSDNDETNFTRVDTEAALDTVDEYNGWVQGMLNAQSIVSSQDGIDTALNIIETLVPFMEGAAVAQVRKHFEAVGGEPGAMAQSLILLGESKEDIRRAIQEMPVENRKELANQVIRWVNQSKGSITGRPNDLLIMNQLRDYLTIGGNEGRFIDNLFSIMDSTIFLSPVFKLGKLGARATAATMRRAEAAAARIEESSADVAEIVKSIPKTDEVFDQGPSVDEVVTTATDMIADSIVTKFKTPATKQAVTGDMSQMVDDIDPQLDMAGIREDIHKRVSELLTPTTFEDPDIVKTIVAGVKDTLVQRYVQTPKTFAPTATQLVQQAFAVSRVRRQAVRGAAQPTSLSQTVKDVNAGKARGIHDTMVADAGGELANVLYGTSRNDAIANDLLPEIAEPGSTVRNKVLMDESLPNPDQDMIKQLKDMDGASRFSPAEATSMRNTAKVGLRDVVGLVPRLPMASIGDDLVSKTIDTNTGVRFDMVYGPRDGGFKSPKAAIDQATFALAKYGVTKDQVELLARTPEGYWAPFNASSVKDGNYLVRVRGEYDFSPADEVAWTFTQTNKSWIQKLGMYDTRKSFTDGKQGGLVNHLIPSFTIVDRLLLDAATVAADRQAWVAKHLLELGNDYAKSYKKLDKRQRALIDAYIIEANNLSLKFDSNKLLARGFTEEAVDTVRNWKRVNDTLYWLENQDMNKSLRARGYEYFVDAKNNTNIVVRPIRPNAVDETTRNAVLNRMIAERTQAYDSATDQIVTLERKDVVELYDRGGFIATTRGPVDHGTDSFTTVIVRNNSEDSYTRRINDNDYTLNYRDGHYTVRYTDPYFITKQFVKDGKVYWKAVATAGRMDDAIAFEKRLKDTDELGVYKIRGDVRKDTGEYEELEWSSLVSSGRTSQRLRGKRLENATGQQTDPDHIHIESPEESLVRSIGSMAARASHRDFIETAKARWVAQFGDLTPNVDGWRKMWPEDVRDIAKGDITTASSRIKDAKAAWRYIESIDSGYVNLVDDFTKQFFKNMSQTFGRKGWGWAEDVADKASQLNPTAFLRKKAFRLLLAANPLRQAPVQAMQALPVIMSTNPVMLMTGRLPAQFMLINYMNRGGDVNSFMKIMAQNATGLTLDEAKTLVKNYELSGFEAAVKANSLIRDDVKTIADRTFLQKAQTVGKAPLNFTQKIGFEAGENALMRSVWLSEYDLLRKSGAKIDARALEQLNARVRHLTLNMNKAGELPYNENSLSVLLQFFQAPHKAAAQIFAGHSGLSRADRIKLGTSYILTYGVGGNILIDQVSQAYGGLPPDIRDLMEGGFFNLIMNKALSFVYGEEVRTDFSDSLRLIDIPDIGKFVQSLLELNVPEALSNAPSLGLVLGDNARIGSFIKQTLRAFTVTDDKKPEELVQAGKQFLSIFSGMSNYFKAQYIVEHQKVINSKGDVVDPYANDMEGWLKLAGFATMDELHMYAFNDKAYQASNKWKEDIKKWLDESNRHLAVKGIANDEAQFYLDTMSEAVRVFGNNPIYMKEIQQQMMFRLSRPDDLVKTIYRLSGYMDAKELKELILTAPLDNEKRDQLLKAFETIKGAR